jgi:hypothetical protein
MRLLVILICLTGFMLPAKAQSAEDSVKLTISQMFAAMKSADAAGLRKVFADSALLQSISVTKEGKTVVRNEPVSEFIDYVGKQQAGSADERISFDVIKTDGPLAFAWTPYKFYFNGELHHCGINSFQLVRLNGEWKVQYIIDTRRRDGCQ